MSTTVDYILKVKTGDAKANLKGVSKQAGSLNTSLAGTVTAAASVVNALGTMAKGAITVAKAFINGAKAIKDFAQDSADLVNGINDLSTRSAIAQDTIKGLQFALRASGQSASTANSILTRFPMILAQVESGTGLAAEALEELGIQTRDAATNKLRPATDIFNETIEAIQGIEDPTTRATQAAKVFGRQAGQLLQALGNNRSLKEFEEITRRFGIRTGPAASDAAADFQKVVATLQTVTEGLKSVFIETFGPGITDIMINFATQIIIIQRILINFTDEIAAGFSKIIESFKFFFDLGLLLVKSIGITVASQIPVIGGFAQAALTLGDTFIKFDKILEKLAPGTMKDLKDSLREGTTEARNFEKVIRSIISGEPLDLGLGTATGAGGQGTGAAAGGGVDPRSVRAPRTQAGLSPQLARSISDAFNNTSAIEEFFRRERIGEIAGMIDRLGTKIETISSPSGLVGAIGQAFGPIGSAVSGIVGGLAKLGEKTPAQLKAEFRGFAQAVGEGLKLLPSLIISTLPVFVFELAKAIGLAILSLPRKIFEAIADLFGPIVEFFRGRKDEREERRENRAERRAERAEKRPGLTAALNALIAAGTGGSLLSGGIVSAQSGVKFTGSTQGLALLHPGESVVPASGRTGQAEQRSMRSAGAGSGGGINIIINSAVVENRAIDELVRRLESRFSQFGAGKTPLFGR